MFYQCLCKNKIQEKDLIPGQNCQVELAPDQMPLEVLKRKGLAFTQDYIYAENIPVFCVKCGRRMKVYLDTEDD